MVCCCNGEEKEPEGRTLKHKRDCPPTDVLFLLLFLAFWLADVFLISLATDAGANLDKISHGTDMEGRLCGSDTGVEDKPFAAWPWPEFYDVQVCLESCNETNIWPTATEMFNSDYSQNQMPIPYVSVEWYYFCVPDPFGLSGDSSFFTSASASASSSTFLAFGDPYGGYAQTVATAFADVWASADLICYCMIFALVMTFIITQLMGLKCCLYGVVCSWIPIMLAGFAYVGYLLIQAGTAGLDDGSLSQSESDACVYGGYIVYGLTFIFLCVIIAFFNRIRIAIEVVSLATKSLKDMPLLIAFPFIPMIWAILFFIFWVYVAALMMTVTVPTVVTTPDQVLYFGGGYGGGEELRNGNPDTYTSNVFDSSFDYYAWFHWFCLLWNMQFIVYFSYLVFVGAAADWYFSREKDGKKIRGDKDDELSPWPICGSVKRALMYHMGTVALTSLIIAIVQFIRSIILWLEKQTKDPPNQLKELLFKCIHCCLRCVECCLDKINKNALIWCAVTGDNFCTSACSSFKLVWANLARAAALSFVTRVVVFIAKLAVAILTAAVCMTAILNVEPYMTDVSSPYMPGLLTFIMAYTIAYLFMVVFEAVVDAIFLCFLIDDKFNSADDGGGIRTEMFAPDTLRELVGKQDKDPKNKAKAKEMEAIRAKRNGNNKVAPADGDVEMTDTKQKS